MERDSVLEIVNRHEADRGAMITILEEVQKKYGYLPVDALKLVAERTGRPLVDIYGIATFYRFFRLQPRGKHLCSVCVGTACHVRGAPVVEQEFEHRLGVKPGETTPDREFTLETVNCLGACALGPIVVIDGSYSSNVSRTKVGRIIDQAREALQTVDPAKDERVFPLDVRCPRCNHSLMDPSQPLGGHASVALTIAVGSTAGKLRLSAMYGFYAFKSADDLTDDTVVRMFCPHCAGELRGVS
ncbi:MAG: NAD(P)H-dependent oxidoreductase subunit E, partial [Acidobacteria bacterium]|nr:NAD(P)H-dependent oxidoreductase subunit E [Acidobacteriota bacterium]